MILHLDFNQGILEVIFKLCRPNRDGARIREWCAWYPSVKTFIWTQSISGRHPYRFARSGKYPVLRGTMIRLTQDKSLLYTMGYIPRLRTYPGPRIPKPLLITHLGDSQVDEICKEIMGLTKLNWNTTAFATHLPITLEFSQKVARVLSELPEGRVLQNHYRFYM